MNAILCGCRDEQLPHVRRELFRNQVTIEAELGSAREVANAQSWTPAGPRLLVLHLSGPDDLNSLRKLQPAFPRWPIMALVDHEAAGQHDGLVVRAMRCGAAQIIHLPPQSHDFAEALEQIAIQFIYTSRQSQVIAVAGATGGCGTTTIAVNLAFELAQVWGMRCILVDLSLKMGMVASHLDLSPRHTMLDLLKEPDRVDPTLMRAVLERVGENLDVLAGPHEAIAASSISFAGIRHVLDTARNMADVVVLDVPSTYDDLYFEALNYAQRIVLVGDQKLPSIRAMAMVRSTIAHPDAQLTMELVINRYDAKCKGFTTDCLMKPLGVGRLRTIEADVPGLRSASMQGSPLRLQKPQSAALADIDALAESLVGHGPSGARKKVVSAGLLTRLGRVLIG
jgi:pilus assembly protein CpaE